MKLKLTDITVRNLALPERGQTKVWDTDTPAFGIRCSQRSKSFIIMHGRDRKLETIGKYPAMSLKQARSEAKRRLATQTTPTGQMTLTEAREAFLAECRRKNAPKTIHEYTRYLNLLTGDLQSLRRQDLKQFLHHTHTLTAMKVFFNWCLRNDIIDRNPLQGERATYNPAKTRVLQPEELKQLWAYEFPPLSVILKLLLLLGQRRTETSLIQADWIKDDLITIPATVTKNRITHTIPFGDMAAQLLPPTYFNGWSKAKARLDKHVPLEPWSLHDLRRTFSTIHAEIGTSIVVTERYLNHTGGTVSGVAAVYNRHSYLAEMRQAVARYESYIKTICGG